MSPCRPCQLAALRCDESRILLLRAAAKRRSVAADLSWRDPQLRIGHSWEDDLGHARDYTSRETKTGEGHSDTITLRMNISNPFVNRWVRRHGDAEVGMLEASASEAAYALACEVRSLCLDYEQAGRELELVNAQIALQKQLCELQERMVSAKVAKSPLDAIKAEAQLRGYVAKAETFKSEQRVLLREISAYTGIPAESLKIRTEAKRELPPDSLIVSDLINAAIRRRPDLMVAAQNCLAADSAVELAKSAGIPWFNFVEGTYKNSESHSHERDSAYISGWTEHDSARQNEWQIRLGIDLPVFAWMGDTVKAARLASEAARTRYNSVYSKIRIEVEGALEDYRAADYECRRLQSENDDFCERMERRIAEFEQDANGPMQADVIKSRQELLSYRLQCLKLDYARARQRQLLETACGGELGGDDPVCE